MTYRNNKVRKQVSIPFTLLVDITVHKGFKVGASNTIEENHKDPDVSPPGTMDDQLI